MHLARLAHKGTILGYREWAVLEGMRTWSGDQRCLLVQPKRKWQRDPKSAGSLDEMAMEEPRDTIASLSFMWLRTEVREEKTKSSLSLCERTRCVCVGGSLGLIAFSFGGHTCCLWMFLG